MGKPAKLQPQLQLERRRVEDLHKDPANLRLHPDDNIDAIAAALARFGQQKPVVISSTDVVYAGNGTLVAARKLGWEEIDVVVSDLVGPELTAYAIADNRTADLSRFDDAALFRQLHSLAEAGIPSIELGFDDRAIAELIGTTGGGHTDPDETAGPSATPWVKPGELYQLGDHRVICGDTTDPSTLARLVGETVLVLLHADPPYGMGKEGDGIANDNLYREKLDAFQDQWWHAWLRHHSDRGSAYVWGNAPDLWRWWYQGVPGRASLCADPLLTVRNEIVWEKSNPQGVRSEDLTAYPVGSERCLFMQRGQLYLGQQNAADYWEGYEPLRSWMEQERDKAGWTNGDVNKLTGTHMGSHWFTRSQFYPITELHYETLRAAAAGRAFPVPFRDLFATVFPGLVEKGKAHLSSLGEQLRSQRAYFDNTHDAMTDVWQFPRVVGDERYGHATPKPVAMVHRAIASSSRPGEAIGVPFGGTGPEVIACEQLGRRAYIAELSPAYCQVIIERWQGFTGKKANRIE